MYSSFVSLGKFIPRYIILFVEVVNGIDSLIKYLGISLPKEIKELYTENYKTLMKEIKDDINIWRDKFHVPG